MATPHPTGRDSYLHVQDCRIWAEISYLDSPTDYRECLPGCIPCESERRGLTMLDSSIISWGRGLVKPLLLLAGFITVLVCGYLLYFFGTEIVI